MTVEEYEEIPVEFITWTFNIFDQGIEVTIWDDGDIEFDNGYGDIFISLDDLDEVVRRAKLFRDRRTAYLANKS